MIATPASLAQQLISGDYGEFFRYPAHEHTLEAVWNTPGNPQTLEALVNDPGAPNRARFLASEVLFARDFTFISRTDPAALAEVYAQALVNNDAGTANPWGLLYEHDDAGAVGSRFLMLGEAALPALIRLLDDDAVPSAYEGSEVATIGNMYRFRVKDFAAFYIGKIRNIPVPFHREYTDRDSAIGRLEAALRG